LSSVPCLTLMCRVKARALVLLWVLAALAACGTTANEQEFLPLATEFMKKAAAGDSLALARLAVDDETVGRALEV